MDSAADAPGERAGLGLDPDAADRPGLGLGSGSAEEDEGACRGLGFRASDMDDGASRGGLGFVAASSSSASRSGGISFVAAGSRPEGSTSAASPAAAPAAASAAATAPADAGKDGAACAAAAAAGAGAGAGAAGASDADGGSGASETKSLSPAELERQKLLEFEEKLNRLASLRPDPAGAEEETCSIYVGGIDISTTAEALQEHFKTCGTMKRITVLQGFAYIEFAAARDVQNALLLNASSLQGSQIKVLPKRATGCKGKSKGKDKDKGKDKGKGKPGDFSKGKSSDIEKGKGKGKAKGKHFTNMVWRPNSSAPY